VNNNKFAITLGSVLRTQLSIETLSVLINNDKIIESSANRIK